MQLSYTHFKNTIKYLKVKKLIFRYQTKETKMKYLKR